VCDISYTTIFNKINYKAKRYLSIEFIEEFLQSLIREKIYVEITYESWFVTIRNHNIKKFIIINNREYKKIIDKSLVRDNRLYSDIINIINKY
jgi:hypothetical protein